MFNRTKVGVFFLVAGLGLQGGAVCADGEAVAVTPVRALAEAREPQAAVDEAGNVYVTYGAGNALYCSTSRDGGRTYAPPVKVAEAGALSLGMRRGPRIAVSGKTVVITAVYGRQGRGQDGDVLAWRSGNGGKTWRGPTKVNDVSGSAREGLHGMAASRSGALACVWLDLRGKGTQIYAAFSRDGGATWGANKLVYRSPDGTVCECCHPFAAYDGAGRLYVMWRNWLGGARDMYLARSGDGGKSFGPARKLGEGTWPLNACPMDGGGLAVSPTGSVTTFWRRDGEVFTCAPGAAEKRVGEGQQGWAAMGAAGPYLVWLERRQGRLFASLPGGRGPLTLAGQADDPVVAAAPSGKGPVVAVWRAGRESAVSIYSRVLTGGPTPSRSR